MESPIIPTLSPRGGEEETTDAPWIFATLFSVAASKETLSPPWGKRLG
jgi:hypothetical protein